jgi:phospholipase/carboxylesterase
MKLVVLLHGYGASGSDLKGLSVPWAGEGRSFIAPNAPSYCAGMGPGYEWFSLNHWMPGSSFHPFSHRVEDSAVKLKASLKDELKARGLSWKDLVLMGFSQGAMMALAVGLSEPESCAGIMAYSGAYLVPVPPVSKPPVLLVHGGADMVVNVEAYYEAKGLLEEHSVPFTADLSPHGGHWIDPQGLAVGAEFLKKI